MDSGGTSNWTKELSARERDHLVRAVMRWNEYGASWYVDNYVAPAVEKILQERAANAG